MSHKNKRKKKIKNTLTHAKSPVTTGTDQALATGPESTEQRQQPKEEPMSFINLVKTDPRFRVEIVALAAGIGVLVIYICQLSAMRESNTINRESVEVAQRAFVAFKGVDSNLTIGGQWQFQAEFQNNGNTPANDVVAGFHADVLDQEPSDSVFKGDSIDTSSRVTIASRDLQSFGPVIRDDSFMPSFPSGQDVRKGPIEAAVPPNRFLWGWVVYRDIFPKTEVHLTEFCRKAIKRTLGFSPEPHPTAHVGLQVLWCKNHNCQDRNCKDYDSMAELLK